ncbi:cupin domain-containing protein [Shewanella surugensis]|uniref:Cupin domain-containing protein n=1 Tax=Shewanella surugensis TaxID=212020 RepID=A0ABT0LIU9_9GAMM|nr:cupin domain-containing protein [Shewanella surugensis]MCL1127595.1 cupin domain-containing protein [Shewanella surugensis]
MTRRIVTAFNAEGHSYIASDSEVTNTVVPSHDLLPGLSYDNVWMTKYGNHPEPGFTDVTKNIDIALSPSNGESILRITRFPPEKEFLDKLESMGTNRSKAFLDTLDFASDNPRHPLMHNTDSLDYGIVISGSIFMVLDDGETQLFPGDIVVQNHTNHAWSNRSNYQCVIAFVLLDTYLPKPK